MPTAALLDALGSDGPDPLGGLLLAMIFFVGGPVAILGAMFLTSAESLVTTFQVPRIVEIELCGTEILVNGVPVALASIRVDARHLEAPGVTLGFEPPLGPEILGPLQSGLEQVGALARSRAGGTVPADLRRLMDR